MNTNNSGSFVKDTLAGMTESQKHELKDHFNKESNKEFFWSALSWSAGAGVVVGTFVALVTIGGKIGDSLFGE